MVKLAANLSTMFQDIPFLDRYIAASAAGFSGVECMFPYEAPADAIREKLQEEGLTQILFNSPAGNWAAGERGLAALSDRVGEFRDGVGRALEYARALDCKLLHLMSGIAAGDPAKAEETLVENIRFAAAAAADCGVRVLIEPCNTRVDMPGYFLNGTQQAIRIIDLAKAANVGLQYDIYHMQIMEGDLARTIERVLPHIAHIQIADNPGRHEPGTGEINYPWLFDHLDSLGYGGWVGCEYRPLNGTVAGLGWAEKYISRQKRAARAT